LDINLKQGGEKGMPNPYTYDPYEDGYDDEQAEQIAAWEEGGRRWWEEMRDAYNADDEEN
jgi:hypothetical protein